MNSTVFLNITHCEQDAVNSNKSSLAVACQNILSILCLICQLSKLLEISHTTPQKKVHMGQ